MTDLRQGVTANQHAILDLVDEIPASVDDGLLDFAISRAKQAAWSTDRANALQHAREAAASLIAWTEARSETGRRS